MSAAGNGARFVVAASDTVAIDIDIDDRANTLVVNAAPAWSPITAGITGGQIAIGYGVTDCREIAINISAIADGKVPSHLCLRRCNPSQR